MGTTSRLDILAAEPRRVKDFDADRFRTNAKRQRAAVSIFLSKPALCAGGASWTCDASTQPRTGEQVGPPVAVHDVGLPTNADRTHAHSLHPACFHGMTGPSPRLVGAPGRPPARSRAGRDR